MPSFFPRYSCTICQRLICLVSNPLFQHSTFIVSFPMPSSPGLPPEQPVPDADKPTGETPFAIPSTLPRSRRLPLLAFHPHCPLGNAPIGAGVLACFIIKSSSATPGLFSTRSHIALFGPPRRTPRSFARSLHPPACAYPVLGHPRLRHPFPSLRLSAPALD